MSKVISKTPKSYQHLATVMTKAFGDGSDQAITEQLATLPQPGNNWAAYPPPAFPMPWATHWGQDEYGLWCGFTIDNILQRMRWIPPGEFGMGSDKNEAERDDDEHYHQVTISEGYWLADTVCTQKLWLALIGENPSRFKGEAKGKSKGDNLPVENISWKDVQQFCDALNKKLPDFNARLPTEAEWEYACRASTATAFWWGNELCTDLANYDGNSPYNNGPEGEYRQKTLAVDTFFKNPWGLYQVHGNVWEWCQDWFSKQIDSNANFTDPTGPDSGVNRVVRGGSWIYYGRYLRAAFRFYYSPDLQYDSLGFRLAAGRSPGEAEK